jgi:hypothetical protein
VQLKSRQGLSGCAVSKLVSFPIFFLSFGSHDLLGSVWLKSQVERSRSVPVLLLFGYKVTRTE